jgi:hypothetical protein
MTKYKALKQALESNREHERHRTLAETHYWCDQYKLLAQQAIEALAQPAQEPVATIVARFFEDGTQNPCHTLEWVGRNAEDDFPVGTRLYTTPPAAQPAQEPVAEVVEDYFSKQVKGTNNWHALPNGTKLYTTPPQRPWVGLMRGVRVEGDTVIISVKGGNDAARELCGALIKEMEA